MKTFDEFIVIGNPQGKMRPRFTHKGGGRTYTPKKTIEYEEHIKTCYKRYVKKRSYDDDVSLHVTICAYYPIPKSYSKAKRAQAERGNIIPKSKPDVDNIAKVVLDALNGVAYVDDKLVAGLLVIKKYSVNPRLCVQIGAFNEISSRLEES